MRQLRSAGIGSRPPILHLRNLASREARVRDRARAHSIPGRVVRQAIIHAPQGRRMWMYDLRVRRLRRVCRHTEEKAAARPRIQRGSGRASASSLLTPLQSCDITPAESRRQQSSHRLIALQLTF